MRIGVISAYPDEDWDAQRIAAAARRRGDVRVLAPTEFGAEIGADRRITVGGEPASGFDLFLTPRAVGERGDAELQLELYRALGESGARVVNDVRALVTAVDKFRSSWLIQRAGVASPRVVVAQSLYEAARAVDAMGRAVVKPFYGSLGLGVELVGRDDIPRVAQLLGRYGALYLQEFVTPRLDVRALVVGDRVAGAIARRPPPGEFRSNVQLGGETTAIELDADVERLAVQAARAIGLDYAGVDLLITERGPLVLEVNGTPSFRAVEQATGRDMAEAIVEHAVERAAEEPRGAQRRREFPRGDRPPRRRRVPDLIEAGKRSGRE
ncbi:MAG TPA: RimK family alpha-L-glutamate ligase [Polyangia bacterium]|nr:RimK family alpha-L-glutamate ligase [Polyangia bacterium]